MLMLAAVSFGPEIASSILPLALFISLVYSSGVSISDISPRTLKRSASSHVRMLFVSAAPLSFLSTTDLSCANNK
ncbi:MAG: hypothetical protein ACD_65C00323G0004 [uncultured bacterium]|nr:MAG: hypothetical protein ACD_65C00323G0004 [uncultured bacterium]